MADKRKPAAGNPGEDRTQDTDRQFLDNANIKHIMKDVLGKLLANRPADPLAFIATYFESLDDQSNLVGKAYQHILLTHHTRPAFQRNLKTAYRLLSQHKVKKNLRGVSGSVYADLLLMLTKHFPGMVVNKLMRKIECMEFEAVSFETFRNGVFTCCVLQDYITLSNKLFDSLDVQKTGKVDKILSKVILDQLEKVLNPSDPDNTLSVLQAGFLLGPEGLNEALEGAYKPHLKSTGIVTREEFVNLSCESFLSKVKPLR